MFLSIIFWLLIIFASSLVLFLLTLVYDRIKYGKWAEEEEDPPIYHEDLDSQDKKS